MNNSRILHLTTINDKHDTGNWNFGNDHMHGWVEPHTNSQYDTPLECAFAKTKEFMQMRHNMIANVFPFTLTAQMSTNLFKW